MPTITPDELKDSLRANILVYGTILKADYITTGVYLKKEVSVEFKLFSPPDTVPVWKGSGDEKKDETYINKDLKNMGKHLFGQLLDKSLSGIFSHPLYDEAKEAVEKATRSLPHYYKIKD